VEPQAVLPLGKQKQLAPPIPAMGPQCSPVGHVPPHVGKVPQKSIVLVVVLLVVVVVLLVLLLVVVVVIAQPLAVHASQQLENALTQALPPLGGVQWAASRFVRQRVRPLDVVRQQVTKPGLPQVDLAAQRTTLRLH
jgi:hypothetical protein